MKKILIGAVLALASIAHGATKVPVLMLDTAASTSGQVIVSGGPSGVSSWGSVSVGGLTPVAANTVLANATGSTATPTAFAMPSCSGANNALRWTAGSGFTCASAIALTSSGLNQFAATTSAQLAGVISDETGSGALVFGTNPTIAGATFTGATSVAYNNPQFTLNDSGGAGKGFMQFQKAGVAAWNIGNASNASNQFGIDRYVSGSYVDTPLTISNATGIVSMSDGLVSQGQTSLGGPAGAEALRAVTTASAVNWVQVNGQTTGNAPGVNSQGSDTNIALAFSSKGTFGLGFYTGTFARQQVVINDTAGANRYLTLTGSNGGNPTIGASAGSVAFSTGIAPSTTAGIVGTTAGDSANAGSVGEYVSSTVLVGSAVSLTSATPANITSISLTAGDWDVWGSCWTNPAGTTVTSVITCWTSTASATNPTAPNSGGEGYVVVPNSAGALSMVSAGMQRLSLASTTTVYLSTNVQFTTSTNAAYGFIGARRRR